MRRRPGVRARGGHVVCHVADMVHVAGAGRCEGEARRWSQDQEGMDLAPGDVDACTNAMWTGSFHAILHRCTASCHSCIASCVLWKTRLCVSRMGTSNGMHGVDRLQVQHRGQCEQHALAFNTAVVQMDPRVHTSPTTVR